MAGAMKRIRDYYSVPAKRGGRVEFQGEPATILSATRGPMYLRLRLDSDPKRPALVHPTWAMTYTDPKGNAA